MNYPVWETWFAGGGLLITVIAVVHVYVAHFAVGGGLFLVWTEIKGRRENSPEILDYTRGHAKFFLLLTMVFGGVTGVAIWFVIMLISPGVTSTLIHAFVFGWAAEWVCFMGEIVALLIYYYKFDSMDPATHRTIGWLYFLFAWLSLFLVNGIICFMLTPGDWLQTGNFWHGFFNPSMWPALFFRTAISLAFCGLFGFVTAAFIRDGATRERMSRYCAGWVLIPLLAAAPLALWYVKALPEGPLAMVMGRSPEMAPLIGVFIWLTPILMAGAILMALRTPRGVKKALALILLAAGLFYMGSFEWIREAARRPWLISNHTWSTSIRLDQAPIIREQGFLKTARWVSREEITGDNVLEAGREIFRIQCLSCHSAGGPMNDILPLTERFSTEGMDAQLTGQGKLNLYMPRFMGAPVERGALARFIVEGLHGKKESTAVVEPEELPFEIPSFDEENDEYVLLAWGGPGMHGLSDRGSWWVMREPGVDIRAQLIKRGETPEIVTDDVTLVYAIAPGFEHPSKRMEFWSHSESLVGRRIPPDIGPAGNGTKGEMTFDDERMAYVAENVPAAPYSDEGSFNPYPLFTITASPAESIADPVSTRIAVLISTEMGCKNCHGGGWRVDDRAGLTPGTCRNVLAVHDRISKTTLLQKAEKGSPMRCAACHADALAGAKGDSNLLNLSAAVHGFHAGYLTGRDDDACNMCHPSAPDGATRGFRGIHLEMGMDCTSCHGKLEDLAIGLLSAEKKAGKKGADRLLAPLAPRGVDEKDRLKPRSPWIHEPDCLGCHVDFSPPETDELPPNQWTEDEEALYRNRADEMGILCQACHGSAHAIYPATNPYGENRDNIPPMQHQGVPYPIAANKNCKVCHTIDMEDEAHHPNSLATFRNER